MHGVVRDDRRRSVHRAGTGMLALDSAGYLVCGAGAAAARGTFAGRSRTASHIRWRRSAPVSSRRATCAQTHPSGLPGAVGDGALVVRFAHDVLAG